MKNTPEIRQLISEIATALSLPETLLACAQGAISVPICTLEAPAAWYCFPPALTPIWSDGSGPTA